MKLIFKLFSLFLLFACLSTTSAHAQKVLVNGIDANYPPFGYVNEKGQPDGFDVKAMDWIAKKMGFQVKHQPMDWDGIIPALLAKKIDMVCSGMSITPERSAQVAFTEPYWTFSRVMLAKPKSGLTVDEVYKRKNIKLGVQRGTSEHEWFEKKKEAEKLSYELRFYDSAPLAIEDLINGRVNVIAMDSFPAEDAISKGKPVEIIGTFFEGDLFGVAVRKEDKDLLKKLNEGYKLLMTDPYWEELKKTYNVK